LQTQFLLMVMIVATLLCHNNSGATSLEGGSRHQHLFYLGKG